MSMPLRLVLAGLCLASVSCVTAFAEPLLKQAAFPEWEFVTASATRITDVCTFSPEGVVAVAGSPIGYIVTKDAHENYRLHVEWRWSGKPGNSGILVHIVSGPKDRAWPECFQIQTKQGSSGDLLPMAGAHFAEPLTSPAGATAVLARKSDSDKPAGEWNSCDIVCRGDTIEVTVNGVLQNKVTQTSLTRGRVGFQFEGAPFELRNVQLDPLD